MNAGGVFKACKSNASFALHCVKSFGAQATLYLKGLVLRSSSHSDERRRSGKRESNTLVTYLEVRDNPSKDGLIPDVFR